MGDKPQNAPEIVLLKSEMEAAAARVAERAMNSTLDGLGGFVGDVFGGLVGDAVKQWRNRNLVNCLAKTKSRLDELGISLANAKALPMGEMYAIFDGMSKQDDPDLVDMWASLLAAAMNPDRNTSLDPAYPKILEQLSGVEAVILKFQFEADSIRKKSIRAEDKSARKDGLEAHRQFIRKEGTTIIEKFGLEVISSAITNLLRLGLLTVESSLDEGNNLISLGKGPYEMEVEYPGLTAELNHIYYRLNLSSNEAEDHALIQNFTYSDKEDVYLPYNLTRLASRLLSTCSQT